MKKHSKLFRSVVALILAFIMVGTIVPTMAFAADADVEIQETVDGELSFLDKLLKDVKEYVQKVLDFLRNLFNLGTGTTPEPEPEPVPDRNPTIRVNSAKELQDAIADIKARQEETEEKEKEIDSATIVLDSDIIVDKDTDFMYTDSSGGIFYLYHVDMTLDLNGHNIIVESDALLDGKTFANGVFLVRYSTLNIVGEGNIIVQNKSIAVYGWAHSTINIYGGTYLSNSSERNESVVYVNNANVTINVYGGIYVGSDYAFNVYDKCDGPVIVLHEGIAFKNFLKDGKTNVFISDYNKGRIVLAEGCELVENGGYYYIDAANAAA